MPICLSIVGLLLLTHPAFSAEYFVSPTSGDDANSGTSEASALKTWNAGDKKLVPGDTLSLLDGVYPAGAITRSGTPDAWITVRAKHPRQAIVSLAAGWHNTSSKCVDISGVSYVKVIGLTVVGCAVSDHSIVDAQDGININGSHHILIQNCRVKDCSGGGIGGYDKYWTKDGVQNGLLDFITVEGNEISGSAFWCKYLGNGISICNAKDAGLGKDPSGYNIIVRNNICYGNENKIGEFTKNINDVGTATDGNGIIIDYLTPNNHYPYNVLVEGNLCYDNGGRGIHVFKSANTTVRYNTCWHNNRNKLDYSSAHNEGDLSCVFADNVNLYDNIVVSNTGTCAASIGLIAATHIKLSNNLIQGPRFTSADSSIVSESGTMIADPKLVNPSADPLAANFRLQPGSPAIDAADGAPAPPTDLDGVAHPGSHANALGAYQGH
jgi:parallel beta-helix repeat protein